MFLELLGLNCFDSGTCRFSVLSIFSSIFNDFLIFQAERFPRRLFNNSLFTFWLILTDWLVRHMFGLDSVFSIFCILIVFSGVVDFVFTLVRFATFANFIFTVNSNITIVVTDDNLFSLGIFVVFVLVFFVFILRVFASFGVGRVSSVLVTLPLVVDYAVVSEESLKVSIVTQKTKNWPKYGIFKGGARGSCSRHFFEYFLPKLDHFGTNLLYLLGHKNRKCPKLT